MRYDVVRISLDSACPRTESATPWKGLGSVSYFKRGVESCILLPLWGPWSHWCRAAKWLAEKKRYIVNNWLRMRAEFKLTIRLRTLTPDGKGQLTRYQGIIKIRQQTLLIIIIISLWSQSPLLPRILMKSEIYCIWLYAFLHAGKY